jgi:hypothetical protein
MPPMNTMPAGDGARSAGLSSAEIDEICSLLGKLFITGYDNVHTAWVVLFNMVKEDVAAKVQVLKQQVCRPQG